MPSVAELDRLSALVNQLIPLSQIQQGDLIKAQHWNTVVGALIEVTRAALEDGPATTVPPHEHPDQVAPGWLTPALRSVLERGPLADPATDARISQIQSRLDALAARIEGGSSDISDLRLKINDSVAKHLALVNDFSTANRKIQGAADAREDVLTLRQSLGTIQTNLQTVQAATLTVDGQPANLQALADRVKSFESFQESMKMPNGEVWSGAALEHRLGEFTNTFVTQKQLDDGLKIRPGKLTEQDKGALKDQLSNDLTVSTKAQTDQAVAALRDEVTQRLAGVDAQITRGVADAVPSARDAAIAAIRPEMQAAIVAAGDSGKALLESRLAETTASITANLAGRIDDVQRGIAPSLQAELDQRIPAALADIRGQVESIGGRAAAIEGRLNGQDTVLTGLGARIDSVSQADAAARDTLKNQFSKDLDTKIKGLSDSVDVRFTGHVADTNSRLETAVASARDAVLAQVADRAGAIASTQVGDMATALRAEMHQTAKDEVVAANSQLPDLVTAQIQQSLADLPQLVDTHVRTALGDVQTLIDTKMTEASNRIQVDVKSRVDQALTGLSPQITKAVKDTLDAQLPGIVDTAVTKAAPKLVTNEVKTQLTDTATLNRIRDRIHL